VFVCKISFTERYRIRIRRINTDRLFKVWFFFLVSLSFLL